MLSSRRQFLTALAVAPLGGAPAVHAQNLATDIRVDEVATEFEDYPCRTPLKFGGSVVEKLTILNVRCVVRDRTGKAAKGFGSMTMGNVWSFPSKTLGYEDTLSAMNALATKIEKICERFPEYGHPVDLNCAMEPQWLAAAKELDGHLGLGEAIPKLCTLVTGSAFDAAISDAYGKLLGRSSYAIYGRDLLRHDLSHYLGKGFEREYLQQYVRTTPKDSLPLYHLVGGVDALTDEDLRERIGDGLPETLPEWIRYSGLTHIKIKLNGEDRQWDRERVLAIDRVTSETQAERRVQRWHYSLDFNEKCPSSDYLVDVLTTVRERAPEAFRRIQYVEQPTKRDLQADRANTMHRAAKLRPVVIDESLTDLESLLLAREMGYSGAALKACKGQAQALLMAAAAQKFKMFLCVQDLTCPGASMIHSAGLAAHVPKVAAIEANARQFLPSANTGWEKRFPGIFDVRNGRVNTSLLKGPGLSAVPK
jgi:L-alanine-DL-glutamate epimerase-like enolase superfamily enzyme